MSAESDSSPLTAPGGDFEVLFDNLAQVSEISVRSAAASGARLGIGFAISCIERAGQVAAKEGASAQTQAWLGVVAETLRDTLASDELARVFEENS